MIADSVSWKRVRLGEVLHVKHGFAFSGEFFSDRGDYVVVTPGNFHESGGFKHKSGTEKFYSAEPPVQYVLTTGDLIIAMTEQAEGLLGSSGLIPENGKYLHNQRIGLVDILRSDRMDKQFLYNLFNTAGVRSQIQATATGSKVRHTAPARIEAVEVLLPPLSEQRRIASILSAYDDLIENNTRRIQILEEMAQAIYREWFVEFRFPGHEGVRMVDSELGPIPEGWETVTVRDAVKRMPAGTLFDSRSVSRSGMIPVLDQGKSGVIGYHDGTPGVHATSDTPVLVFANHTCYQRLVHFPFSAIQNVLPFVPSPGSQRDVYWLHWATKNLVTFNDYKGHWPEFVSKDLLLPPPFLCARFGAIVRHFALLSWTLETQIVNLRQTRDLLLPRLISGEIDVSELDLGDV